MNSTSDTLKLLDPIVPVYNPTLLTGLVLVLADPNFPNAADRFLRDIYKNLKWKRGLNLKHPYLT
jgi:hypothetical protein